MKLHEILKDLEESKIKENTQFISNEGDNVVILFNENTLKLKWIGDLKYMRDLSSFSNRNFRKIETVIEECIVTKWAEIDIKNYIGNLDDLEYLGNFKNKIEGEVTLIYDTKNDDGNCYRTIPIDNKVSIPYVENGTVKIVYQQKVTGKSMSCSSN